MKLAILALYAFVTRSSVTKMTFFALLMNFVLQL